MIKFSAGGWYQAFVSVFDQYAGIKDSGLRVIVQIERVHRYRDVDVRRAGEGYDYIEQFKIHVTNTRSYQHYGQCVHILPPGVEGNNSDDQEFAVIQMDSAFGWPEFVLFGSGYEIPVEEAQRRLSRPVVSLEGLVRATLNDTVREQKFIRRAIIAGDTHGVQMYSFDEGASRRRIVQRADELDVEEAVRDLRQRLSNGHDVSGSDGLRRNVPAGALPTRQQLRAMLKAQRAHKGKSIPYD